MCFFVRIGINYKCYIQAGNLAYLVYINLRKDNLFFYTNRIVSPAVEAFIRKAPKVPDTGAVILINLSRNSNILALLRVTMQPTGIPARSLKLEIAFLAFLTDGLWPAISSSSLMAD